MSVEKTDITYPAFAVARHRIGIDGDGVTTLVCSTGCPLRCRLCINPMSYDGTAKVRMLTPEQLYKMTVCDDLYFRATGGGITFGGGEPLLRADFISRFREICGSEWTLNAETCLNVDRRLLECAEKCIDVFIVDIKDTDPAIYRAYTGADNARVLGNLKWLVEKHGAERIRVRVPLIPGFNTEADADKSEKLLKEMGVTCIDRFTYTVRDYMKPEKQYLKAEGEKR